MVKFCFQLIKTTNILLICCGQNKILLLRKLSKFANLKSKKLLVINYIKTFIKIYNHQFKS